MILLKFFKLILKIITLPFSLIKKLFEKIDHVIKKPKKTKINGYMQDLNNLINLNLPINSLQIHFDEENGLTYDIISKEEKKSVKGLKNESIKKDAEEISRVEEETSEKKATNTIKKKVGRPKKTSSEN